VPAHAVRHERQAARLIHAPGILIVLAALSGV